MQHIPLFNRILECGLSSTAHHYLIGGKYSSGPWFRVQDLLATVDTADLASPPTRHQQGPVGDGKALAGLQKFGATLNDYMHLILPPIVKLFDSNSQGKHLDLVEQWIA